MKQFKKLIACVLAATLVLGSTTVVFGADNSQTGSLGGGATLEYLEGKILPAIDVINEK